MKKIWFGSIGMLSFFLGLCSSPVARSQEPQRFDHVVRNDFFAGFAGDEAALQRGMEKSGAVLKENPNHAEALVWNGAGLFFLSGREFRKQNQQAGMEMWTKGMAQMDKAVELAPDHIGVRIPRGSALLATVPFVPPQMKKELIDRGIADYQHSYDLQQDQWDRMGTHPRGELLLGLANAYTLAGQKDKVDPFLQRAVKDLPDSIYARTATKWLEGAELGPRQKTCLGCHTAGAK